MATGVLLVCVGPATRLTTLVQESSKSYVSEFTLGMTSDTDDSSGTILSQVDPTTKPTSDEVVLQLSKMTGSILQTPPTYSAVHVNGQRAYKLARQGESVDLTPRTVEVHSIGCCRMSGRGWKWKSTVVPAPTFDPSQETWGTLLAVED